MYTHFADEHTNFAQPKTSATITVRIIKSFQFRTEKSLVLRNLDLTTTTVKDLREIATQAVQTQSGWTPYRNVHLDTLKLYSQAHGAKTTNLIINLDHDDWVLDDDNKTLADCGFGGAVYPYSMNYAQHITPENETEVSFFNCALYEEFRGNPRISWD